MSVEKVMSGGAFGYGSGNDIWNRKTAGEYGPTWALCQQGERVLWS